MKLFLLMVFITLLYSYPAFSDESKTIKKTSCLPSFGESESTIKDKLLIAAKRSAAGELFGEFINSFSKLEKTVLTSDEIETSTSGFIRVKGNPDFTHGKNLGEICVAINAYTTKEDREKITPKSISKKSCLSDGEIKSIKERTEKKAKLAALGDFDTSLKKLSPDNVLPLIKEVSYSDAGFIEGTSTYCTKASGVIHPVEINYIKMKRKEKSKINKEEREMEPGFNVKGKWTTIFKRSDGEDMLIDMEIFKTLLSKKSAIIRFHHPSRCYMDLVFSFEKNKTLHFHGVNGNGSRKYDDIKFNECPYESRFTYKVNKQPPRISVIEKHESKDAVDLGVFEKIK